MEPTEQTTLSREELYALVWAEPMLKLADRFRVSSSYLARICTLLRVPRPERGYWAKMAAGKKLAPQPALPAPLPGDDTTWVLGVMPMVAKTAPHAGSRLARLRAERAAPESSMMKLDRTIHPLVRGVRELFASGKLSYDVEYLKPQKRLLPDIIVSLGCLDKALALASELYKALDAAGHRAAIASHGEASSRAEVVLHEGKKEQHRHLGLWRPGRCTVVYVNDIAIGITIFEMTELVLMRYVGGKYVKESEYLPPKRGRQFPDHTWTTTKDCPTKRLCIQAYSPYDSTAWNQQWREGEGRDLAKRIPEITRAIAAGAEEVKALRQSAMKEREEMLRQWDEEEARRKAAEAKRKAAAATKASKEELLRFVAGWDEARRLSEFFATVELRIHRVDAQRQPPLLERVRQAKMLIGDVDPLSRLLEWQTPNERLESEQRTLDDMDETPSFA